jgi:hypothetical protein
VKIFKNKPDYVLQVVLIAIEEKSLVAILVTILIDFIFGKNYCIRRYCKYKNIEIKNKWF